MGSIKMRKQTKEKGERAGNLGNDQAVGKVGLYRRSSTRESRASALLMQTVPGVVRETQKPSKERNKANDSRKTASCTKEGCNHKPTLGS